MRRVFLLLAFMLVVAGIAGARQPDPRIPIFVRSAVAAGGFTDPDKARSDSVRDLQKSLKNAKVVRLVEAEDQAVILLEVLGRETRREVNGYTFLTGEAQNKSVVMVRLTAAGFSTEFSADGGSSGMVTAYGRAAKRIADQVERWVRENRPRLIDAMRPTASSEAPTPPPAALTAKVELEGDEFVVTNADRDPWGDVILEVNGTPTVPGYRAAVKTVEAGQVIRIRASMFCLADGRPLSVADVHPVRLGILASIQGRPGVVVIDLN
jgi:hypothetical protein